MKILSLMGILVVISVLLIVIKNIIPFSSQSNTNGNQELKTTPTALPTSITQNKLISVLDKTYAYAIIGPVHSTKVSLHSNLPEKISSLQLKEIHQCTSLTSGGFYGTNNRHIGLFLINDEIIQEQIDNDLFHAYVWKTLSGDIGIGQLLPDTVLDFALQSGPLLMTNHQPRTLRLQVDEEARRIAIGVTNESSFIFYIVHDQNNVFLGPTLVDLPKIIYEINLEEELTVPTVLNLDGGNHSTFQHEATNIGELSPAGSIFCIKT